MEDKYIKIFTNPFKMIEADINKCLFTKIFSHVGLVQCRCYTFSSGITFAVTTDHNNFNKLQLYLLFLFY